jgi:hypothetical protein
MVLLTAGASASSPAFNFARSADSSTFPKVSRMRQRADGGGPKLTSSPPITASSVTESVVLPPDVRDRLMFKRKAIEEKRHEQSETARQEAAELPFGKLKDQLLREPRQLQTASQINRWLSSPGLRPPI